MVVFMCMLQPTPTCHSHVTILWFEKSVCIMCMDVESPTLMLNFCIAAVYDVYRVGGSVYVFLCV